ncbi:MAG: hypothetical protein IT443_06165 [Phycisphaeraceae bacterium]|nr:hypothetical protein [Phycisphaeraceae bacterium]
MFKKLSLLVSIFILAVMAFMPLAGCSAFSFLTGGDKSPPATDAKSAAATNQEGAAASATDAAAEGDGTPPALGTEAYAKQLTKALDKTQAGASAGDGAQGVGASDAQRPSEPPEILWIDLVRTARAENNPENTSGGAAATQPAQAMGQAVAAVPVVEPVPAAAASNADATAVALASAANSAVAAPEVEAADAMAAQATDARVQPAVNREKLLEQYVHSLRAGSDPIWNRAVAASHVSLVDSRYPFDPADFPELTNPERASLLRYTQLMHLLQNSLLSAGRFDRQIVMRQVDEVFAAQPLRIRRVELCRRVDGYGIYDPVPSRTLLVGRDHRLIVYVELDDFTSVGKSDGSFEVKLAQELSLFNEADGLAVWRQPRVEIVDQSRNRRQDFFIVQVIDLPARLTVGKFILKTRITDLHNQTLDETSLSLELVADHTLTLQPAAPLTTP